ncbi:MAG: TonB-dependent receptor plug domain-containing protein, partial [Acetobacteraceae bacterium]
LPAKRLIGVGDLFAQDSIALTKHLSVTAGVKLEDSTYTGLSPLPTLRLGWQATKKAFFWAAVSRAVRTPSRIDRELQAPGFVLPALDFTSEKLTAFEIGYRGQPLRTVSASVSFYYNLYSDIRTTNVVSLSPFMAQLGNDRYGDGYGLEAWATVQVLPNWRVMAGANLMRQELKVRSGVVTIGDYESIGDDPNYQLFLRSTITLPHNLRLTTGLRSIDALPDPPIPHYTELTARLGWQATKQLELFVAGTNLIGPYHAETANPPELLEPRRSVYVGLRRAF